MDDTKSSEVSEKEKNELQEKLNKITCLLRTLLVLYIGLSATTFGMRMQEEYFENWTRQTIWAFTIIQSSWFIMELIMICFFYNTSVRFTLIL